MTEPWYRTGLQFECTGCGDCCTRPGYVWVGDAELAALAVHLGMPVDEVRALYARRVAGTRWTLRDRADGACVFYGDEQGCTVYPARPRQCRTYPFWDQNVSRAEAWRRTCAACEGTGRGRRFSCEEITTHLHAARRAAP